MNTDYYCGKLNRPGIDQHETFYNSAFIDALLDVAGDVDEGPAGGDFEPALLAVTFHP